MISASFHEPVLDLFVFHVRLVRTKSRYKRDAVILVQYQPPLMAPLSLLAVTILAASSWFSYVQATQIMHRPDNFNGTFNNQTTNMFEKRATGKVSMGYYTNWSPYTTGRNFPPQSIIPSQLTHIIYAFADVSPDTGIIALSDTYADTQLHFATDSWSETGNNLYGCLKQMYLLKLAHRNLKVLLSVGGWTYAQAGHFNFVTSASSRAAFVTSAVSMVENYGFDGIDIDYEYPANAAQGQGFADLLSALRSAFDALAAKKGDTTPYQITAAVSAGAANYANLVVPQMNAALSYWNLMAYDYAGSWLTFSDNMANLYGGARTGVNTDAAVSHYLSAGATASKISMGIPLYGRAFENTAGLGQPYNGIGPGTFEAGVYNYNVLPFAGASVIEDTVNVASYSYNSATEELVSYDTPNIARLKAQYMNAKGLAGSMFWDLSSDKQGADSLVQVIQNVLGAMDSTLNHINYPNSMWDNIRSNMGGGTPTGTTTSPTSTATSSPGSGTCSGVAAWSSTAIYTGGLTATYNGKLWTAQWWTQGDVPGGAAGVWIVTATC
ncbi:glycoside hydrolase family 18 protein [Mycena floridula]|nr:glycoside hydrolase family 18 protein [Mycena floridula]